MLFKNWHLCFPSPNLRWSSDFCIVFFSSVIADHNFLLQVRAAAVFALGTLLDIGFGSSKSSLEDEFDDDEKIRAEEAIIRSLLDVVSDGSPLVRSEVAVGTHSIQLLNIHDRGIVGS